MSSINFVPETEDEPMQCNENRSKVEVAETTKGIDIKTEEEKETKEEKGSNAKLEATEPSEKEQNIADLSPGLQQRYLADQWIARYPDGPYMKFMNEEWKEIKGEDEIELIQQLWYEQEAQEVQVVNGVKSRWNYTTQQWEAVEEVDDDFIAQYQANYGIAYDYDVKKNDNVKEAEEKTSKDEEEKKKKPQTQGWVDMEEKVHAVYVTNLPLDIDEEEFQKFMGKCGVVQLDPRTNKPKVKLYRDEQGNLKGDGRCCYVKKESIDLALSILDGAAFKGTHISVERAHFELKGDYDPKKKKRKLTVQQKKRFLENQNKIFAWIPEKPRNYRPKSDCTVIVKNVFTLEMMQKNAALLLDLKEEMQASCAKYGTVKKVVVYDNNPDGVVSVQFTNTEESDLAIKMMNGRIVDGRLLTAHHWDGKTKYMVAETEEEKKKRLEEYHKFIGENSEEDDESDEEKQNETKETRVVEEAKSGDIKNSVEDDETGETESKRVRLETSKE